MDLRQFSSLIKEKEKEIDHTLRRRLPIKTANAAQRHYKENFRKAGFVNGGLHAWKPTKRQLSGRTDAASQLTPLLSSRKHLSESVKRQTSDYKARIYNDVPYAWIHNYGGTNVIHPAVTPKMRGFAWAKYYELGGESSEGGEAGKWKALALTKKTKLTIRVRIPQRQFIGQSAELDTQLNSILQTELESILKE